MRMFAISCTSIFKLQLFEFFFFFEVCWRLYNNTKFQAKFFFIVITLMKLFLTIAIKLHSNNVDSP